MKHIKLIKHIKLHNIILIFIFNNYCNLIMGQSVQDLQQMKNEYEKQIKDQSRINPSINNDINNIDLGSSPREADIFLFEPRNDVKDSLNIFSKFYGYDFFIKKDTSAFWENLPTPDDYLLGPGDEIIISLWGATQFRQKYIISREGKIYDEKVGSLNMIGKSIKNAEIYITNQFGRVYSTLKGRAPTTYIDLSLGKLRSINISIVGEAQYPGIYPIHPFSNLITGIIQAGGIDTTGSLRNIKIKRSNEIVNVDLYDYFINGNISTNIQLRDQDIIVIPARASTVFIDSTVHRPGIYESIPNETVKDMLYYAGGLKYNASKIILLNRNKVIDTGVINDNNYLHYSKTGLIKVLDGDRILVNSVIKTVNQVEIIGQVQRPGIYSFQNGMKIKDLLNLSTNLSDTSYWKSIYLNQAELVRRDPKSPYEIVIDVNLKKLLSGDEKENHLLNNLDRFLVHSNPNYFKKKNITITGEVAIPGNYPISKDNEPLKSIIKRSGGLTSKALTNGISIYRYKSINENYQKLDEGLINSQFQSERDSRLRVAWENENIIIMPGDSIVVKKSTNTVNVFGEIYNPGLIEYEQGRSVRYYINSAGGMNENANRDGIVVIYPNGVVRPYKWYFFTKIEDGSTIFVNRKEIIEPFNVTQFATNWTSIISSMITAVVLSQQLGSAN